MVFDNIALKCIFKWGNGRFRKQNIHWNGISIWHQSKAGRPKRSGLKCSMDGRTSVASRVSSGSMRLSGIITTCIPASRPALTPFGASSNTRQFVGWGVGCGNLLAQMRKMSGDGLPWRTSGSDDPGYNLLESFEIRCSHYEGPNKQHHVNIEM